MNRQSSSRLPFWHCSTDQNLTDLCGWCNKFVIPHHGHCTCIYNTIHHWRILVFLTGLTNQLTCWYCWLTRISLIYMAGTASLWYLAMATYVIIPSTTTTFWSFLQVRPVSWLSDTTWPTWISLIYVADAAIELHLWSCDLGLSFG